MSTANQSTVDIEQILERVPHFDSFLSLEQIHELVDRLRANPRFDVSVAGESAGGVPIHHVRFGSGSVKALLVAGPQAMEPIGGLTVFSLMSLLERGDPGLVGADVSWHVVPCIDPDAALLNEGWYSQPFTLRSYVHGFYMQPRPNQVDFSFPIRYKELVFDRPSTEAQVLKRIMDQVRPDFYFTLHNYGLPMGGTWFAFSRAVDKSYYRQIADLVGRHGLALQTHSPMAIPQYSAGMREIPSMRQYYDYLEREGIPIPKELREGRSGASSYDYLFEINPQALTFVAELPYGCHPADVSDRQTGQNLRQLKLRLDADNKFLATVLLEEWDKVGPELDQTSPFYAKIQSELIAGRDALHIGVTEWYVRPIHEILFNRADGGPATERARIDAYNFGRILFLCNAYSFVRLLQESTQTPGVRRAIDRLEPLFEQAISDVEAELDFTAFRPTTCDTLAKVQLGSGLIALGAVVAARAARSAL